MANLLNETLAVLEQYNKTTGDVLWVGSTDVKTTWIAFAQVADVEYDEGYGGQEVAEDLLIVGETWWLERHEYDGSEWWEYKELPVMPEKTINLVAAVSSQSVGRKYWNTLEEMNG